MFAVLVLSKLIFRFSCSVLAHVTVGNEGKMFLHVLIWMAVCQPECTHQMHLASSIPADAAGAICQATEPTAPSAGPDRP